MHRIPDKSVYLLLSIIKMIYAHYLLYRDGDNKMIKEYWKPNFYGGCTQGYWFRGTILYPSISLYWHSSNSMFIAFLYFQRKTRKRSGSVLCQNDPKVKKSIDNTNTPQKNLRSHKWQLTNLGPQSLRVTTAQLNWLQSTKQISWIWNANKDFKLRPHGESSHMVQSVDSIRF